MKNLVKRGNIYYWRRLIDGKRKFQSLKTGDKTLAESRARALNKAAYDGRFEVIDAVRSKRLHATLCEVFAVFLDAAAGRGVVSASDYCAQLRNIVRKVHGAAFDVDAASTSILTAELISQYVAHEFKGAGANILDQETAKRTIKSTVINARSVFARWTSANNIYKKLELPDLTAFKAVGLPWKTENKVYHLPDQALIDKTIQSGRALREKDPRLYAVFLLCYDLGLRAGEAMAIEWNWFTPHAGEGELIVHANIVRRENFRPKWNRERHVPLNGDTWRELQALRQHFPAGQTAVLPGGASDREDLIIREFAAWMRGLGWKTQKCAHELRKLIGSQWYSKISPQYAQEKLGHVSINTTCRFYARLASKPQALPREEAVA